MLVDSHCHLDQLDLSQYDNNLAKALTAAQENGVGHILCVCIDMNNVEAVLACAKQYTWVSASVGVHPNTQDSHDPSLAELIQMAEAPHVVAIGETGLDYFRSEGDLTWQHERFRRHIQAAITVNKPLIIHTREAREDTIRIMQEESAGQVGGVMHCFTETLEMAEQAMALGFYISFSGIVTFKNAQELQALAKTVPLDRMLVETDAPYLAPVPYRGKTNQPAYVRHVAEFIAELRGISYEELAAATTDNFFKLFTAASRLTMA